MDWSDGEADVEMWQSSTATLRLESLLVTPISPNRCLPSAILTALPSALIRSEKESSPKTFNLQKEHNNSISFYWVIFSPFTHHTGIANSVLTVKTRWWFSLIFKEVFDFLAHCSLPQLVMDMPLAELTGPKQNICQLNVLTLTLTLFTHVHVQ